MGIFRSALLWGSESRWLEQQFRRRRFARKAVSRFMPGEDVHDALREAEALRGQGIRTVVTCLGENVHSEDEARGVADHYVQVVEDAGSRSLDCHVSVKLTHMGLDLDRDLTLEGLVRVAQAAANRGSWVWVDMEYSRYVDATLDLFEAAREQQPNLGLCLQAYLHRTPEDLERIAGAGAPVRLVKGAYQEPPEVAIAAKSAVDEAFRRLSARLAELHEPGVPAHGIATHDLPLLDSILSDVGPEARSLEVQMLYGIQRAAQRTLADQGTPVRVLISYGTSWFPWYMRRLAERPANVGFVVRSMFTR